MQAPISALRHVELRLAKSSRIIYAAVHSNLKQTTCYSPQPHLEQRITPACLLSFHKRQFNTSTTHAEGSKHGGSEHRIPEVNFVVSTRMKNQCTEFLTLRGINVTPAILGMQDIYILVSAIAVLHRYAYYEDISRDEQLLRRVGWAFNQVLHYPEWQTCPRLALLAYETLGPLVNKKFQLARQVRAHIRLLKVIDRPCMSTMNFKSLRIALQSLDNRIVIGSKMRNPGELKPVQVEARRVFLDILDRLIEHHPRCLVPPDATDVVTLIDTAIRLGGALRIPEDGPLVTMATLYGGPGISIEARHAVIDSHE